MEDLSRQVNVRPEEFNGLFKLYLEAYNVNQLSLEGFKTESKEFKRAWEKFVIAFEEAHEYYDKEEQLRKHRKTRRSKW